VRLSAVLGVFLGTITASAQILSFPSSIDGLTFSPACQASLISVFTNGSFAECFHPADLFPITLTNAPIVPTLDKFMSDLCYGPACSNATLMTAASTILAGCAADLKNETLSNSTVTTAFSLYPLVREVLCLKTQDPYTNLSYGGVLGNPPIPVSSPIYNSTNGTFCVTSVLTQLSAYFGTNLTLPFIEGIATLMNTTALGLAESINVLALCNDCVFGAVDVVEDVIPSIGSTPLSTIFGLLGMTSPVNTTINGLLNGTCAYKPLAVSTNGTLPSNITVSIINSTFPYNLTSGNHTFSPALNATMIRRSLGLE